MKKLNLLLFTFLSLANIGFAQTDTTYEQLMEIMYGNLDETQFPTNIFYDLVPPAEVTLQSDGSSQGPIIDWEDWALVYNQMRDADIDQSSLLDLNDYDEQTFKTYKMSGLVKMGVLHYNYHRIKEGAVEQGLIDERGMEFHDSPYRSQTPYEEHELFVAIPLITKFHELAITFKLDQSDMHSNRNSQIEHMEVDFGDGAGYRAISFGEEVLVQYPSYGIKLLKYKMVVDGAIKENKAEIELVNSGVDVQSLPAQSPDVVRTITASRKYNPPPVPEIEPSDYSSGEYGIWYRYPGRLPASEKKLYKPIIIVSGFDPGEGKNLTKVRINPYNPYHLQVSFRGLLYETFNGGEGNLNLNNGAHILDKLREEGYDVIILDFFNGTDYLQNGAYLLIDLINKVNKELRMNASDHELVVMGYSAGAMSARYALNLMEKEYEEGKGPDHRTRMYISFEGEHQGTNIPMGLQHFVSWMAHTKGSFEMISIHKFIAQKALKALTTPIAYTMLSYYFNSTKNEIPGCTNYKHDFFGELFDLRPNTGGYPYYTRNVSISDGSSTGAKPNTIFEGLNLTKLDLSPLILTKKSYRKNLSYNALKSGSSLVFDGVLKYGKGKSLTTIKKERVIVNNALPYDNAPGSYTTVHNTINKIYNNKWLNLGRTNHQYHSTPESFCPTISALDIRDEISRDKTGQVQKELTYNVKDKLFYIPGLEKTDPPVKGEYYGYPHLAPDYTEALTPFDAVFASKWNKEHIENPTKETANFILKEVAPENLYLQNNQFGLEKNYYVAYEARKGVFIGKAVTQTETPGNVYVGEHAKAAIYAGEEITFEPGFEAKVGSELTAQVDNRFFMEKRTFDKLATDIVFDFSNTENYWDDPNYVAVDENEIIPQRLNVFPNPSNGQFNIELPEAAFIDHATLTVHDLLGNQVYGQAIYGSAISLDLSFLARGVYTVNISNETALFSEKIVIQ